MHHVGLFAVAEVERQDPDGGFGRALAAGVKPLLIHPLPESGSNVGGEVRAQCANDRLTRQGASPLDIPQAGYGSQESGARMALV